MNTEQNLLHNLMQAPECAEVSATSLSSPAVLTTADGFTDQPLLAGRVGQTPMSVQHTSGHSGPPMGLSHLSLAAALDGQPIQPSTLRDFTGQALSSGRRPHAAVYRTALQAAELSRPMTHKSPDETRDESFAMTQFTSADQFVKSLPSGPGTCSLCGTQFKVLKTHARRCFTKRSLQGNLSSRQTTPSAAGSQSILRTNIADLSSFDSVDAFLKSLPKAPSGICPICAKFFPGLKKHARVCFSKNHSPFNFSDSFFEPLSIVSDPLPEFEIDESVCYRPSWLTDLSSFASRHESNFNILHLNINSARSKSIEVSRILSDSKFDLIIFQESKLGPDDLANWLCSPHFELIRRDRCRRGGGILVFVNKRHTLQSTKIHDDFESIVLKLRVSNLSATFIISYCPHFGHPGYIDHLEDLLLDVDSTGPTYIIGDLNLLTTRGKPLTDVLSIYNFRSLNSSITRPSSSSLIDVIFSNSESLDCDSSTVECPFSDHCFLVCSLSQLSVRRQGTSGSCIRARCLNERTLDAIKLSVSSTTFGPYNVPTDINQIWTCFSNQLLATIDAHAPLKNLRKRKIDQPWVDNELLKLMLQRDHQHSKVKSIPAQDRSQDPRWTAFIDLRNRCKSLYRRKMKDFFQDKTSKDFKNSKKFWKLYKTVTPTKSSVSANSISAVTNSSGELCTEPQQVCDAFNSHFSNYELPDDISHHSAYESINQNFLNLKKEGRLSIEKEFSFAEFTSSEIEKELKNLDPSSSAGVSALPAKVLKHCAAELAPTLLTIFNHARQMSNVSVKCLMSGSRPWSLHSISEKALNRTATTTAPLACCLQLPRYLKNYSVIDYFLISARISCSRLISMASEATTPVKQPFIRCWTTGKVI